MASYQVPQFLDSGDKILLNMNLRQFGYALAFAFIAFIVFQVSFTIVPSAGYLNLIPATPFILLGAYLALGKYNSRDAEVYVLASILHLVKPKKLIFVRVPDLYDLEEKLSSITSNNIAKRMKERLDKSKQDQDSKGYNDFDLNSREEKARKIRELATFQDNIAGRTREEIIKMDIQKDRLQTQLNQQIRNPNNQTIRTDGLARLQKLKNSGFKQSPLLQNNPQNNLEQTNSSSDIFANQNQQNFLAVDKLYKPGQDELTQTINSN